MYLLPILNPKSYDGNNRRFFFLKSILAYGIKGQGEVITEGEIRGLEVLTELEITEDEDGFIILLFQLKGRPETSNTRARHNS